jgi:hypothetical protein
MNSKLISDFAGIDTCAASAAQADAQPRNDTQPPWAGSTKT